MRWADDLIYCYIRSSSFQCLCYCFYQHRSYEKMGSNIIFPLIANLFDGFQNHDIVVYSSLYFLQIIFRLILLLVFADCTLQVLFNSNHHFSDYLPLCEYPEFFGIVSLRF
jgi:hypothetical protein